MATKAKFKVGDKVRFTPRVTKFIADSIRRRTRTIVSAFYDSEDQCTYYELGDRGKASLGYLFRSYMLRPADNGLHTIGRPTGNSY